MTRCLELGRIAGLLKRGEFTALRQVVEVSGRTVEVLQDTIDALVDQVREAVEGEERDSA